MNSFPSKIDLPSAPFTSTSALKKRTVNIKQPAKTGDSLRRPVAHSRDDLARLGELAGELDVVRILGEVDHGSVAADVENRIIVVRIDVGDALGGRELLLHDGVGEELDALLVLEALYAIEVSERKTGELARAHLDAGRVNGRMGAGGGGEVDGVLRREGVVRMRCLGQEPALCTGQDG